MLGLPGLVVQAGLRLSLFASIFAPGPVKSVTLPVGDRPAAPPREPRTVPVCRDPVEAPPFPKPAYDSATASPAWDVDGRQRQVGGGRSRRP